MLRSVLKVALFPILMLSASGLKAESSEIVEAVWQEHNTRFFYSSFDTYYSCSGIEDSVERILKDLGAKDVKARALGCGLNRVERSIPLRVTFKTLTSDRSVSGEKVKAQFSELDFAKQSRRKYRNAGSQCDLLEEVEDSLLEKFEHQIIKSQRLCNSGYASLNDVTLAVKVLRPVL